MTKTAMVTGASGGIGLGFAERLAKEGYTVTLVARNEGKLTELAAGLGAGHRVLAADLSVAADAERVADDLRTSKYDVLINNAGVGAYGPFAESSLKVNQAMLRLNIDSVVTLSHAFLQNAKSGDALINVASTLACITMPGASAYCASKAFVTSFSESLWYENKPRGVYVAGLLPGVTKTNFHMAAGGATDNRPPEAISQSVEGVVDAGMHALAKRSSPTVLTSFQNKAMVFMMTKVMPRTVRLNIMGGNAPGTKALPRSS